MSSAADGIILGTQGAREAAVLGRYQAALEVYDSVLKQVAQEQAFFFFTLRISVVYHSFNQTVLLQRSPAIPHFSFIETIPKRKNFSRETQF